MEAISDIRHPWQRMSLRPAGLHSSGDRPKFGKHSSRPGGYAGVFAIPSLPLVVFPVRSTPACRGACRGAQQEDSRRIPACPGVPWKPEPAPASVAEAPPGPVPSQPAFAQRVPLADGVPPYVPQSTFVPDTRVPFSIKVNPFKHRR